MKRILILGCSGSGKSTLARRIGEVANVPVVHLDQHYFHPNWVEKPGGEWNQTVAGLCSKERWVMDGNYTRTLDARLERANMAIFIDYSVWTCLWRVFKRTIMQLGKVRQDAAPGCPERFDLEFVGYILSYARQRKPKILEKLRESGVEFKHLRSEEDILKLLAELASRTEQARN